MKNENVTSKKQKIDDAKNRQLRVNKLLTQLKNAKQRHEKCRLRNQLRKLNHYGALRNRTFFDKTTSKTIIIERKKINA